MITFETQPQNYAPTNEAIFKITSDQAGIIAFKVVAKDHASGTVIVTQKYATLPMLPNGTVFNLAPMLASFVEPQIIKTDALLAKATKSTIVYDTFVTELYRDGSGDIVEGVTQQAPGVFILFNGLLSSQAFADYDFKKYVIGGYYENTVFLSRRPLTSNIYYSSLEYLYFLSSIACRVEIAFYKRGQVSPVSVQYIDVPNEIGMFRINLSPKSLALFYGDDILNNYGSEFEETFDYPFGTAYKILDANYFTVRIVDIAGNSLSETRTYALFADDCKKIILELLFANNLGGVDTIAFTEPKQTINSAKTTIDANPYQYDDDANLKRVIGGVFNPQTVVIGSATLNSFSVISEPLKDAEMLYGTALIESDSVYAYLSSGNLYPVVLDQQDYTVLKRKYSTDNKRMSVTFKIKDVNFKL